MTSHEHLFISTKASCYLKVKMVAKILNPGQTLLLRSLTRLRNHADLKDLRDLTDLTNLTWFFDSKNIGQRLKERNRNRVFTSRTHQQKNSRTLTCVRANTD